MAHAAGQLSDEQCVRCWAQEQRKIWGSKNWSTWVDPLLPIPDPSVRHWTTVMFLVDLEIGKSQKEE